MAEYSYYQVEELVPLPEGGHRWKMVNNTIAARDSELALMEKWGEEIIRSTGNRARVVWFYTDDYGNEKEQIIRVFDERWFFERG